jgi:hypothetical protein
MYFGLVKEFFASGETYRFLYSFARNHFCFPILNPMNFAHVFVYVCVFIYIYIYIYKHFLWFVLVLSSHLLWWFSSPVLSFSDQNFLCISFPLHNCYMTRLSNSPWYDHQKKYLVSSTFHETPHCGVFFSHFDSNVLLITLSSPFLQKHGLFTS